MMAENAAWLGDLKPRGGPQLRLSRTDRQSTSRRCGVANEPELLFRISAAVRGELCRTAFPSAPRCGSAWMTRGRRSRCAQALAEGGVELLVVHARTKADGYRPPAHWEWVARIAETVPIPVVANGEGGPRKTGQTAAAYPV